MAGATPAARRRPTPRSPAPTTSTAPATTRRPRTPTARPSRRRRRPGRGTTARSRRSSSRTSRPMPTRPPSALAREALPRVGSTPSAIVVSLGGLDSALSLPKDDEDRAATIAEMEAAVRKALADPAVHAAADDRSGAYLSLMQARQDAGDAEGAKKVAAELAAFLEGEAAKSKTPDERAVFDSHRTDRVPRARPAGEGRRDAAAVGEGPARRLQPAEPARPRLRGDEAVGRRRSPRRRRRRRSRPAARSCACSPRAPR